MPHSNTANYELPDDCPPVLKPLLEIPEPPQHLWLNGKLPAPELNLIAVVGSRRYSTYGKQVVDYLIESLRSYPIGIVSGLAIGIDALAHSAALRHGLYTLAVPGSSLEAEVLYPAQNRGLAERILEAGGGLLTEFPPHTKAAKWTFPKRNRIMAGLTKATLLIEAGEKSGTLITARMAVDYNRELLAVPGNIFSTNSFGVHQFIKLGATPVTCGDDIINALGIKPLPLQMSTNQLQLTAQQNLVIKNLREPTSRDQLIRSLHMAPNEAGSLLMEMEMAGYIKYEPPLYIALIKTSD